jgi:hypothetical protein
MGLSDAFDDTLRYTIRRETPAVLSVRYDVAGATNVLIYDFVGRVMITRTGGHGDGGIYVTPFAQLDRETLIEMRDKLIALKGTPPDLPPEAPATLAPANKLRL